MQFQQRFYRSCMLMFETLLSFKSPVGRFIMKHFMQWSLIFFAFNMLNYARLTPVYLSQIIELKEKDPQSWEFLQRGNFSVNKSAVPSFLVKMSLLLNQFASHYDLRHSNKTKEQYQLYYLAPRTRECQKIPTSYPEFWKLRLIKNTDTLRNVVTNKVIPDEHTRQFLSAESTSSSKCKLFIEERLIREKSIWDPITKTKIPTFISNNNKIIMTIKKKLVNLREERKPTSRFLVM